MDYTWFDIKVSLAIKVQVRSENDGKRSDVWYGCPVEHRILGKVMYGNVAKFTQKASCSLFFVWCFVILGR